MEERAGVLPAAPAERDRPRMDPPNVLWFTGTFATGVGVSVLISTIPDSQNGLWVFFAGLAFLVAFALASLWLMRAGWWVPGGLAAALAVATVPGVTVGFLQLVDTWPERSSLELFPDFSGHALAVALVTAIVGLAAFLLTRFTFILAEIVAAFLIGAQFFVEVVGSPDGDDRASTALVAGALMVVVGVLVDAFGRRREAFWFHVLGWLSVALGLTFFAATPGDSDRGWIPMLVVGVLILMAAGPMRRASWAVYGVLGYYAAIVHYVSDTFDDDDWPFALLLIAVGVSLFAQGMLIRRYSKVWAERFVRRPPPAVGGH